MNRIVAGIALLLWLIPLLHPALSDHLSGHDVARVAQLFLLTGASLWWLLMGRPGVLLAPAGRRALLHRGLLAVLVTASTLLAPVPMAALRELLIVAGLWALASAVAANLATPSAFTAVLRAVAVGTLAHAGLVLLVLAASVAAGAASQPWGALIGFDNPRFLNHVQTVALPLVAVVSTRDDRTLWRRLAWMALLLSGMILFITYGRATLLALLVGLVSALICFGRRAWPYALRTATPTLVGMGLMWGCYLQWLEPGGYSISMDQLTHAHFRGYLIDQALKLWGTSPWLGVGPMHFAHWYNGEAAHPHNIYLQLLAEYGAPAALLILFGVGRWWLRMLKSLRNAPDEQVHIAIGLWGALVGLAVDGGFSGNFVMPLSQLWIALAIALVVAFHHKILGVTPPTREPTATVGSARPWTPLRCLFAAGLLWLTVQSSITCLHTTHPTLASSGAVGLPKGVDIANPRFWTIGWF